MLPYNNEGVSGNGTQTKSSTTITIPILLHSLEAFSKRFALAKDAGLDSPNTSLCMTVI
jgi:hypothetical protein